MIGADKNITPREVIRDFIELLNLLYQNQDITIQELINSDNFEFSKGTLTSDENPDAETDIAEFEI